MERLTIPDERIDEHTTRRKFIDVEAVREHAMGFYWRLKAYEDTELEPEEVLPKDKADEIALKLMRLADLEEFAPYDRLRELAEADKTGRVVVLPVRPVLRPDISSTLYIIEGGEICEDWLCGGELGMSESGVTNAIYTTLEGQMSFEQVDFGKTVFLTREEAEKALEVKK